MAGFEPVRLLGRGGFAEVFLYRQSTPRRQVALKVLHTCDLGDKAIEQLAVEADTMAELSTHPHIATIYTSGLTDDGRPYLAMEYCPKPSLNIGLRTVRRTISEVLSIGVEIAGAVETAHRAGVLHRDIKPANILVTQYDNPVLTDFGIAVSVRQSTDQVEGLSVPWSPPEAFTQPPTAGPPSDVWGLAATVYSLLAGRAPFEITGGDNTATVQMGRIERDVLPPVGRVDCPASLDRVLAVGMAKDPERRYASALVFGRALQRVQAELGIDPTRMVIKSDSQHVPVPVSGDDADEITLTRLRDPRLVEQPELTRPVEPAVFGGVTGPTKQAEPVDEAKLDAPVEPATRVEPDALAESVERVELDGPVGSVGSDKQVESTGPTRKAETGEQPKPPRTAGPGRKAEPAKQVKPPRTAGPGRRAGQVELTGATSPTDPSGQTDATSQAGATGPAMPAVGSKLPDETLLAPTLTTAPDIEPLGGDDGAPAADKTGTGEKQKNNSGIKPAGLGSPNPPRRAGDPLSTPSGEKKRYSPRKTASGPNRTLRRGLIGVAAALAVVIGGAVWAMTTGGEPGRVDEASTVQAASANRSTPTPTHTPTPTPTPSPKPTPKPTPTEPTLREGTCLSVSPGELQSDPPKDWKTMEVGCATRRAAVRLVSLANCPEDSNCSSISSGTTLWFVPLPAEGVCFPAFEIGNTGSGSGWVRDWSPCDNFHRPWFADDAETKQRIAGEHGVSVDDLRPTKWKIDKLAANTYDCESWYWENVVFDGTAYVVCASMQ
ncbi:MAG: protein kinase [Micrococcales bacterium]|nr:protein kinase [Micrococcales bacterium]